ncbi:MAG TPA: 3-deoxy-7-phosphoheptulonate synthase [Gemmatimonadaceae bacterium]|nr:3-deoxy-7-phosphoheptulonate synthase [Gemmatimonadaceae bacterium]
MIIITRSGVTDAQLDGIREVVERAGLQTHLSRGTQRTIIGCIGDERKLAEVGLASVPGVESVIPVLKPYRQVAREFRADPTIVSVGDAPGAAFGSTELAVIAGPCSVEGLDMLTTTAHAVRTAGARLLRGGAFKPRTSPYAFRGLGEEALAMLADVRAETGLPVVTEVMDTRQVDVVAEHADMLQVGARNMQNFALLSAVGDVRRPVLLKRGLSATVEELLLAAEYILSRGNDQVVLCERGIRTFETATRNTLDVAAVPVLKRATHLPVIVDPSHAGGIAWLVAPLAFAAIAAGADGLIVEVHPEPAKARSDADQSLTPDAFADLMRGLAPFALAAGRQLPTGEPAMAASSPARIA